MSMLLFSFYHCLGKFHARSTARGRITAAWRAQKVRVSWRSPLIHVNSLLGNIIPVLPLGKRKYINQTNMEETSVPTDVSLPTAHE